MSKIILADNHEQVYPVLVENGLHNAKLAHIDFHCDMRGILIDRLQGKAFFTSQRESTFIDRGNFLAHAIMNGIVGDLRWVHGPFGGRGYDDGPVVSYESDVLAPVYRWSHKRSGRKEVSLKFEEGLLSAWEGPREDEFLDIDWDTFASVEYTGKHRDELIAEFFERDFSNIPTLTTLIYSPGYSDPDRTLYYSFAEKLAEKFDADITELPKAALNREGESSNPIKKLVKSLAPTPVIEFKRNLGKSWRKYQAMNDLKV